MSEQRRLFVVPPIGNPESAASIPCEPTEPAQDQSASSAFAYEQGELIATPETGSVLLTPKQAARMLAAAIARQQNGQVPSSCNQRLL